MKIITTIRCRWPAVHLWSVRLGADRIFDENVTWLRVQAQIIL